VEHRRAAVGRTDYQSVFSGKNKLTTEVNQGLNSDAAPVGRGLGVGSLYVLLGNIFTLIVGLPLQIYVARVLGPDGIGVFGLLEAVVGTAVGLLGLGIGQTATRFLPAHLERGEYGDALGLVRFGGIILLAVGGTAYLIVLLSLPWIGNFWPDVTAYRKEIAAMGMMIPIGLLTYFLQQSLRGFQEIRHVILGLSVVQLTVKAILTVAVFAIGLRLGGYILATIFGSFCGFLWLFVKVRRKTLALSTAQASVAAFPQWYRYAFISYSGALIGQLTWGLDRFLLGALVGSVAVGVLLVARQLQNFPERFHQMLLMVGAPMLSAAHSRGDRVERQHIYCLMTDWSVRCSLPLVLFLLFFGRHVLALYGAGFAERGTVPMQILVAAQFFGQFCGPVSGVALMSGLERQNFLIMASSIALDFVLYLVLIPKFEIVGVAGVITFGIVFVKLATMILIRRKLSMHWWDKRYLTWLPQAGVNILLALLVSYLAIPLDAAELFSVLTAMYAASLLVNIAFGLHEDDRDLLRHIWAKVR
jgi:O-antigen/teichoic acid export membrane protein